MCVSVAGLAWARLSFCRGLNIGYVDAKQMRDYNASIDSILELQMATITIRNIDDTVKANLRIQAAQHGHSMEEEARQILAQALQTSAAAKPTLALGTRLRQHFTGVGEIAIAPRPTVRMPTDFSSDVFTQRAKKK